jgi:hypothetical protein
MEDAKRIRGAIRPQSTEHLDRAAAELAGRQHGIVARWQLLELGFSRDQVKRRMGRDLHRLHQGVYAYGHRSISVESRWIAATLAFGPRAVLSHRSAAQLWGLLPRSSIAPEVTRPGHVGRPHLVARQGLVLPDEIGRERGIPVTSVPRTLFDLAATRSEREVERAWNEVELRGYTDALSVLDLVDRYPGRRGTLLLARLAGDKTLGITRSELEEAFLGLVDRFGLPRPRLNAHLAVRGRFFEIDCLWEDRRVAVELDGAKAHGTIRALNRDRERDRILAAEGYTTTRITWDHIHRTPTEVADDLRRILTPYPSSNEPGALRPLSPR